MYRIIIVSYHIVPQSHWKQRFYVLSYHSYQDCPIDFHIRQSVPISCAWTEFHQLSHAASCVKFRVSESWYRRESYACVDAKFRVCGTVKSELGQWIRIRTSPGTRSRLKRNPGLVKLILLLNIESSVKKLGCAHICASKLERSAQSLKFYRLPSNLWIIIDYSQMCITRSCN